MPFASALCVVHTHFSGNIIYIDINVVTNSAVKGSRVYLDFVIVILSFLKPFRLVLSRNRKKRGAQQECFLFIIIFETKFVTQIRTVMCLYKEQVHGQFEKYLFRIKF